MAALGSGCLGVSGGAIEYIVRSETPFDVYFFADEANFAQYDAYIKGRDPERTPSGLAGFSQTAVPAANSDQYEATSEGGGNRQSVDVEGSYFFAVDHSNYRMETRVDEYGVKRQRVPHTRGLCRLWLQSRRASDAALNPPDRQSEGND